MPGRRDDTPEAPSRGKLRRQQQARDEALTKLARTLVGMGEHARKKLPLDDTLREEIALAGSIAPGTGQRRQLRRITQLLREGNAAELERALNPPPVSRHAAPTAPADVWLERLVAEGDAALAELVDAHPDLDRPRVRQWLRATRQARERAAAQVAAGEPLPRKDKSERVLRRYLAELLAEGA